MQFNMRHIIAAAIVVATLLAVGIVASLLQDNSVESRRLDVEAVATCVPVTPARALPTQLEGFIHFPDCPEQTTTPTPDVD